MWLVIGVAMMIQSHNYEPVFQQFRYGDRN